MQSGMVSHFLSFSLFPVSGLIHMSKIWTLIFSCVLVHLFCDDLGMFVPLFSAGHNKHSLT